MNIASRLSRRRLGFFPTPIVELNRLAALAKGPKLLMKRDDQTGLGLGGNKTRKLEFLMADALSRGADTVITAGAEQSNHCRQTAAAAAACSLECHLVLGGSPPSQPGGNLLLDLLFGAHIHWAGDHRKGEDCLLLVEQLKSNGRNPYMIPYGGSCAIGAAGFATAVEEVCNQLHSAAAEITHVVFASSSGGTQAGLMTGCRRYCPEIQVIGIDIDKGAGEETPFDEHILDLANQTTALLGAGQHFSQKDVVLCSDYLGDGYGVVGQLERRAISLTARLEGILLDPVYTGRAMGGLLDLIGKGYFTADDTVLFWHTGGTPALFAYADKLQPDGE